VRGDAAVGSCTGFGFWKFVLGQDEDCGAVSNFSGDSFRDGAMEKGAGGCVEGRFGRIR
jgi:hypothetical protein